MQEKGLSQARISIVRQKLLHGLRGWGHWIERKCAYSTYFLFKNLWMIFVIVLCHFLHSRHTEEMQKKKNNQIQKASWVLDMQRSYLSHQYALTVIISSISAPGGKSKRQQHRMWVGFRVDCAWGFIHLPVGPQCNGVEKTWILKGM